MINDPLAPAEAEADRTVSALQGAPPAPMPGAPSLAPAVAAADATATSLAGAPAAPMPNTAAPSSGLAALAAKNPGRGGADMSAAIPSNERPPGFNALERTTVAPTTPGGAQLQLDLLDQKQQAETNVAEEAVKTAAVIANKEYFTQRAAEEMARARFVEERKATDEIANRVRTKFEATAEEELEPGRVFSGKDGAWPVITTILGAVVGGLAAGPVGAMAMLFKGIDREIRRDLDRQKDQKGSRLDTYNEILGDQNLAYQRLYSQQLNIVAMQAETLAAESKARGANSEMVTLAERLRMKHTEEAARVAQGLQVSEANKYVSDLYLKMQQKPGKPVQQLDPETAEELEVFKRNSVDPKDAGWRDYVKTRVEKAPYLDSVKTASGTIEQVMARHGGQDVPGIGIIDSRTALSKIASLGDHEAAAVAQTTAALKDAFGRLKSGGAIGKEETATFQTIIEGRGTLDDLRRGIEIARRLGQSALDEYDRGFPHFARASQQLEQLRRGRGTAPDPNRSLRIAPPGPSPGIVPANGAALRREREKRQKQQGAREMLGIDDDLDAVDDFLTKP